jgi:hypothetical protein
MLEATASIKEKIKVKGIPMSDVQKLELLNEYWDDIRIEDLLKILGPKIWPGHPR